MEITGVFGDVPMKLDEEQKKRLLEFMRIRCFSCGTPISHLQDDYNLRLRNGEKPDSVFESYGLNAYCCRTQLANPSKLPPGLLYNNPRARNNKIIFHNVAAQETFNTLSINLKAQETIRQKEEDPYDMETTINIGRLGSVKDAVHTHDQEEEDDGSSSAPKEQGTMIDASYIGRLGASSGKVNFQDILNSTGLPVEPLAEEIRAQMAPKNVTSQDFITKEPTLTNNFLHIPRVEHVTDEHGITRTLRYYSLRK